MRGDARGGSGGAMVGSTRGGTKAFAGGGGGAGGSTCVRVRQTPARWRAGVCGMAAGAGGWDGATPACGAGGGAAWKRRTGRTGTADWLSPKSSNNRFFMGGTCLRTGRV
jgi:hypothetical protein